MRLLNVAYRGCLYSALAGASWAAISGPVNGFVFDPPTGSIRPIIGIVGASYLGPAALSDLQFASVAPNGHFAVVIRNKQVAFVRTLGADNPGVTPLSAFEGTPAKFAWAQDSSAFVMMQGGGGSVLSIHSLTAGAPVSETIDISELRGTLNALAVSSSPNAIVVGIHNPRASGIYNISPNRSPDLLCWMDDPAALVFNHDGSRLYAADGGPTQRILRIDEISSSSPAVSVVLSLDATEHSSHGRASESGVSAIAVDRAETVIYLFGTAPRAVRGYSLQSAGDKVFDSPLSSAASNVSAISQDSLFLVNPGHGTGEALMLLNAGAKPELLVVPAGTEQQ